MDIEELERNHGFKLIEHQSDGNTIIKVVGVGGGGGNAISHMYRQGIPNISYALCNTDRQAMEASTVPTKIVLGPGITKGHGAGNKPEKARMAAEESIPELTELFQDGTEMVFITAGMGGGTGTGAGPVVARVAHEMGLLTIGIVTVPFRFEGPEKIKKALEGAVEMSKHVDALLIINNQILVEQFGDLDWITAFSKADDTLSNAAKSIAEIIYTEGYMNVDFEDVKTTLKNGGAAVISTGYGEGEKRVSAAVNDALNSPLLRQNDIKTSKRILFYLYSSSKSSNPLKMAEIDEFRNWTEKITGLDLIYGVGFDDSLGDKVKVSILASGFESVIDSKEGEEVVFGGLEPIAIKEEPKTDSAPLKGSDDIMEKIYGKETVDFFKQHKDSKNFIILTNEIIDNDTVLELLESIPAFNRSEAQAEEIRSGKSHDDMEFPDTNNDPLNNGFTTPDGTFNFFL